VSLAEVEAKRAERRAKADAARDEQKAKDLEAIMLLEDKHGESNIATVEIGHTPGLPVVLAVRCPSPVEVKRYRDTVKPKRDGTPGDPLKAAQELAAVCLVYPDAEVYKAVLEARPGTDSPLGVEAIKLSTGRAEAEGKG
jgi:hypothetical protein